jgi:nitrite reductase/ring-hydroxylating ferredoxin subunit
MRSCIEFMYGYIDRSRRPFLSRKAILMTAVSISSDPGVFRMCRSIDDWACLAKRDQITPSSPLSLPEGDNGIGLFDVDGQLYAIEDICPHGPSLLSRGYIMNGMVKCPLHGAVFDIRTGKCLQGPAERDLQTYSVRVDGEDVYIQIENR